MADAAPLIANARPRARLRRRRRRQDVVALTFAGLSVAAMAAFAAWLLVVSFLDTPSSSSSCPREAAASRMSAGVLLSQVVTCLLLLIPLTTDCCFCSSTISSSKSTRIAIPTSRAAAVGASLTGFSLVLTAAAMTVDPRLYVLTGMIIMGTASLSLMASFWPSLDESPEDLGQQYERVDQQDELSLSEEEEIIFSDARQDPSEANVEDPDSELGPLLSSLTDQDEQHGYHLLEDDADVEAPVIATAVSAASNNENDGGDSANDTDDDEDETTALIAPATGRMRGTRRLLQLAAPQVFYLYTGCAVLLIRLPFSLAIPHFVSTTLTALAAADYITARHEIVYLVMLGTMDALLDFWCVFLFGYANQKIVRGLRLDLFGKLLRQDVAFFDTHSSGSLASRLNSDCSEMAGDLSWFFRFSIESVVRITGISTYMLVRCPTLAACALAIVPVVAAINKLYGDWLRKNAIQVQEALARANSVAQEALANIRTVVAFGGETHETKHYQGRIDRQYQLNVQQLYMSGVYYMFVSTFLINTIVQASLLWIGTLLIERDQLSAGVLLAFMLYQGQLQNETLNLFQSYSSLIKSSGAGDVVFELLDRQPPPPAINSSDVLALEVNDDTTESDGDNPRRSRHGFPRNHYNIQLCDVSFHYASRPNHAVLQNLNLSIAKGQTVALVGPSGCGKSTVVNLLQRLYDPCQGSVRVDGIDLRNLDLLRHRRHLGVVTQDPLLFSGSVLENITYGCPGATREQAIHAAQQANADPFIQDFPDGYETDVGERGVKISGGQKQRIALARAIVRNPALLCLDEATASLDVESEHVVQQALDQLLQSKNKDMTTVVVAHRLRTVRNADTIAFLEGGRVVEQGTHDELMQAATGRYRRMVERAGSNGVLPEN